ncbi:uncharacterized protein DDB_G0283697-like [Trichomycterus rosablanca]|uniref:uncharacterized protein DDB_G0283697-like n=1 Tax=Trichomycterus rosablanca TaxID=2290929 RepID=UPI002F355858
MRSMMASAVEETRDDISAGKHGKPITTEENVEQRGADEGEEQRSPDDEEEEVEQKGADEGEEQRSPDDEEEEVEQKGADEGEEQRSPDDEEEEVEQKGADEGEKQRSPDDNEEEVEQRGADEGEKQRSPDDDDEEEVEQRGADEGEEQRAAEERAGTRPYSEDPSEWPSPHEMSDSFRQYMVENGPQKCSDGPYPRSDKSKRRFSKAYCFRLLSNGEKVERDWLLYSKSTNRVYCFACKLFGEAKVALTTCDVSRDIIQEIYPASRLLKGYNALEKLNFLIKENLDLVFPNLTVALRVFLTMPLTVASAERSFSKLKLIKTYLRSSMSNDRLTQLAVISIENNVARSISFDSILDKWASAKARHKITCCNM